MSNIDNKSMNVITYVAMALLLFKLLVTKYPFKEFIIMILLIVVGILILQITESNGILISVLTVFGAKNIDIKRLLRICLPAFVLACFLVVICSFLGLTSNTVVEMQRLGIIQRNSLGFIHPNILHAVFSIICALYLYIYYYKIQTIHLIVMAIANVILFVISGSRTGCITLFLVLLFTIGLKSPHIGQMLLKISFIFALIIPLIMILFTVVYPFGNLLVGLNALLSGRIAQAHAYLLEYPVQPFGSNIVELTAEYKYWHNDLDCGYARLLINYGWVYTAIYIGLTTLTLRKMWKEKRPDAAILILNFLLAGIAEGYIVYVYTSLGMLFWIIEFDSIASKRSTLTDLRRANLFMNSH